MHEHENIKRCETHNSLTHLGNIGGYVDENDPNKPVEGAMIERIQNIHKPKYYTKKVTHQNKSPWYGKECHNMFDNYMQKLNYERKHNIQGFPDTYTEYKVSAIPLQNYETYKPMKFPQIPDSVYIKDYPSHQALIKEHFGWNGPGYKYEGMSAFIWKMILVLTVFLLIYKLFKLY